MPVDAGTHLQPPRLFFLFLSSSGAAAPGRLGTQSEMQPGSGAGQPGQSGDSAVPLIAVTAPRAGMELLPQALLDVPREPSATKVSPAPYGALSDDCSAV